MMATRAPKSIRQRSTAELVAEWHRLSNSTPSAQLVQVDEELARRALDPVRDDSEALAWMVGED